LRYYVNADDDLCSFKIVFINILEILSKIKSPLKAGFLVI